MSIQHHNKFNFLLLKTLAKLTVLTSLFGSAAGRRHYEPPEEDNVFSPPVTICETNQDGFGGTLGAQFFTLTYNYELEVLGPGIRENDLDDILFALERNIANFFLRTQDFRDTECGGQSRRLRIISSSGQEETTPSTRRLRPIGISTNPPDGPTGLDCASPPLGTDECEVIDGALQVYTVDSASNNDLSTSLLVQLRQQMNNGGFDDVLPDIVKVTYVDLEADRGGDEVNEQTGGQVGTASANGGNTAVYIGAALGAVLFLFALLFYRKRNSSAKSLDDEEFTHHPGSSNIVEPVTA